MDERALLRAVQEGSHQPYVQQVRIVSEDGEILADAETPDFARQAGLQVLFPIKDEKGRRLGDVMVEVSLDAVDSARRAVWLNMVLALVVSLSAVSLISWWAARRISAPIRALGKAVDQLAAGQDAWVEIEGTAEVQRLQNGFNQAAQTLSEYRNQLESRIADATTELAHKNEQLELANQAKTRLLAASSHDLRQPLHAATLFVETLSLSPDMSQGDRHLVQRTHESLTALAASLNGMLDISRLDAGAVTPHMQPVSLHQLFVALQNTHEIRADAKNLTLRIRAPEDAWVRSDALLLERLLGNLLDNAIKHTHKGGVLMRARRRPGTNASISIEIIDSGPGIAVAEQERIYDEFYQLHNPQRDRNQGLGLGLSIVKRLSVLLDHPLTLRSRPGRGCRFGLQLPLTDAPTAPMLQADAPADSAPDAVPWLPKQVLLLDDDQGGVQALASLLARYGVTVSAAHTVEQARALLGAPHAVQAVIADYRLPGPVSGLDFLRSLKATHPDLPMLMMTGETTPGPVAAIRQSAIPCLFKPAQPKKLLAELERMARQIQRQK
jgi:signal transduction histidine kinase/ActR/RegA family two-component response regulator